MRLRHVSAALGMALAGCPSVPRPDRVHVELPEVVLNRDAIRPVIRARHGTEARTPAAGEYALSVVPADLARTTRDGMLACAKSGDGKVNVDVGGTANHAVLRCRLTDRIEVGAVPLLDLRKGPIAVSVRTLDKSGAELSDVPIAVSSTNPDVASVKLLELTPVAVGLSTIVVRAGGAERRFDTRVVRSVELEATPLRGGRRVDVSLPPGKYEIEVALREPKELRIDWRGARQCNYRATAATHRSVCLLAEQGSVAVDNPAFLESGDTTVAKERIAVREVP